MDNRREARQAYDAKRAQEKPWRAWYATKRWALRRSRQLVRIPWCEPCRAMGKSRLASVANHKIPHRGDPDLFWKGELESCCEQCHNQAIQRAEGEGFRRGIDADGWPADPAHPFNKGSSNGKHK